MTKLKSKESVETARCLLASIDFPEDVCSRLDSVSHKHAFFLARPFFLAQLSNKEPEEDETAKALLQVMKLYSREELRKAKKNELGMLIRHMRVFEDVAEKDIPQTKEGLQHQLRAN